MTLPVKRNVFAAHCMLNRIDTSSKTEIASHLKGEDAV